MISSLFIAAQLPSVLAGVAVLGRLTAGGLSFV
jgi:hypothetical protein